MRSSTSVTTKPYGTKVPWGDVLLSAIAAVSWALIGMAGTAALGLHLLEADTAGSLGPMTAAVVALGSGGSVTPSGDVSAFGLSGAQANTAIEITPLGVSLVGALLLSWFFLRSLRAAGVVITPAELLARAGAVVALFTAMLGGLAWAGHDVITIDGATLGLDDLPGGAGGGGLKVPGLGDIGGLLPDRLGDLVHAKAAVGFTVDTAPTLLGGLAWSAGILLIALLASRRTPLPRGLDAAHRVVRPAASALVTVLLTAVAAGLAAAVYASVGDDHPRRIAGAALLGAPNGTWLGIPIGLFVPYDGQATGVLTKLLPHPLDDLLSTKSDRPVTLGRLAELDGRVCLLGVGAALMMLLAGVLTAVRTPVAGGAGGEGGGGGGTRAGGVGGGDGVGGVGGVGGTRALRSETVLGFAGRCALRLGVATALALPLLGWLTTVSVDASLSVLGFDAFGAGVRLNGHLGAALVLGALWGAGAGAVGALLARACGAAGRRAAPLARGVVARAGPGPNGLGGTGVGVPGAPGGGLPAGGPLGHPGYAGPAGPGSGPYGSGAGPHSGGRAPYENRSGAHGGSRPSAEVTWPSAEGSGAYAGGAGPHARQGGGPHREQNDGPSSGQRSGPYGGGNGAQAGAGGPGIGDSGGPGDGPGARGGGAAPYAGEPGARAGAGGSYAGRPGPRGREPGAPAGEPGAPAGAGGRPSARGPGSPAGESGPYVPGIPHRPPNPDTNPYLRMPDGVRGEAPEPEDARPDGVWEPQDARPGTGGAGPEGEGARPPDAVPPAGEGRRPGGSRPSPDVYGAPTVARPLTPPPRRSPGSQPDKRRSPSSDDGPPPPPPPPPAPPRRPKGPR